MKSLALVVPRSEGERVRRELADSGCLRTDLKIRAEGDSVVLPLARSLPPRSFGGEVEEREFDVVSAERPRSYRELLHLDEAEAALLPRAFDVVGEIVLIRLPRELEGRAGEVGEALLAFVPGARLVGLDRGVKGPERLRALERIAGSGPWTTRHSENGLSIEVDLERAYFSPRLAREHALVAAAVRAGERVYDLCCGVGPFALSIARDGRAREIVAVDFNPDAIRLLKANLERLGLSGKVRAVEAPLEGFLPSAPTADRVILNLPREGIKYIASVGAVVGPGGTLHYYEMTEKSMAEARSTELARQLGSGGAGWSGSEPHVVHPFAPTSDLVAYTLRRERS
jgi:tRNA (guanine37-N1)-methyltransferase